MAELKQTQAAGEELKVAPGEVDYPLGMTKSLLLKVAVYSEFSHENMVMFKFRGYLC